jgi:hypothetical protein
MLQVASLLVVGGGLVVILVSDINRHQSVTAKVEPPASVSMMQR